jgi:hypothetical protein
MQLAISAETAEQVFTAASHATLAMAAASFGRVASKPLELELAHNSQVNTLPV